MTRGEKILSDLSNETPLSPPFGLPPRCCSYIPPMCLCTLYLSPKRERRRKPAGQRWLRSFGTVRKEQPPHTHKQCALRGREKRRGGKDKKEWPRITHRKKECVELRGTNLPHAGQSWTSSQSTQKSIGYRKTAASRRRAGPPSGRRGEEKRELGKLASFYSFVKRSYRTIEESFFSRIKKKLFDLLFFSIL